MEPLPNLLGLMWIEDMASALRTTVGAIRRRMERKELPPHFILGGRAVWRLEDVRAWLEQQAREAGALVLEHSKSFARTDQVAGESQSRRGRPRKYK